MKIIIASIGALALSLLTTYWLYNWLVGFSLSSHIKAVVVSQWQIFKLFLIWLIYYFSLIVMPFLSNFVINLFKFKKDNLRKTVLFFEIGALLFSWIATPPDYNSTILFFLICQPIVLVNSISISRNFKRI